MNQALTAVGDFVNTTEKLAAKHHAKVSIEADGKEIVIADHSKDSVSNETVDGLLMLIKNNYPRVQEAKQIAKEARQRLNDALLSSPDYSAANEAAKEAIARRKAAKARAMQNPEVYKIAEEAKSKTQEAKELQLSFSDWLVMYGDVTGAKQLDLGFSRPLRIKKSAKLG